MTCRAVLNPGCFWGFLGHHPLGTRGGEWAGGVWTQTRGSERPNYFLVILLLEGRISQHGRYRSTCAPSFGAK